MHSLFLLLSFIGSMEPGPLVVVGGGATQADIVRAALELGGGKAARVVILPQASSQENAGEKSVEVWTEAGAASAVRITLEDLAAAKVAIENATVIWFPGGKQSQLMEALPSEIEAAIRSRHTQGAVVGGTSAGAAVMSKTMIVRDGEDAGGSLAPKTTPTAEGLGLWPGVIVDQHFVKRKRLARLLGTVLDHPDHVGIGIDEGTAVIVRGTKFEVIGRSSVIVMDARRARREPAAENAPHAANDVVIHALRAGMSFDLAPPQPK